MGVSEKMHGVVLKKLIGVGPEKKCAWGVPWKNMCGRMGSLKTIRYGGRAGKNMIGGGQNFPLRTQDLKWNGPYMQWRMHQDKRKWNQAGYRLALLVKVLKGARQCQHAFTGYYRRQCKRNIPGETGSNFSAHGLISAPRRLNFIIPQISINPLRNRFTWVGGCFPFQLSLPSKIWAFKHPKISKFVGGPPSPDPQQSPVIWLM